MLSSARRGNNPQLWQHFLDVLDDRLQLGLLDHLKRAASYHFEGQALYIEPATDADYEYLTRPEVLWQLRLLADDTTRSTAVEVRKKK